MLQVLGHGRLRISERSSSNEAQISDQLRQDLAEAFELGGMICILAPRLAGIRGTQVNYTRLGGGHWSPIGGWSDGHVLILDTNDTRLPPHWVKLETLTKSMCSLNRATGKPRGYLLLRRGEVCGVCSSVDSVSDIPTCPRLTAREPARNSLPGKPPCTGACKKAVQKG
ncbi:unnamed protein product [Symbiodinium necroappetens]|uniref:glutathione gamma-glutamylcysteinyltransferase n=1 Tax=Symbiodinium necroappetens TaxID=1628268 RepID=A0A812WA95_9DINO|nr:unnamed protein product [Symbiodinium necroappetens]